MSGGFFRGTSADQDTRFSNKQAKLLKSQKFAPELEYLVDMTKVKMDVMKPWIAKRVTELIGFEDEVLINFIYGLLEGKAVNGKQVQISLTGFMERNTGKFMKELWMLLLSAQQNVSGVPQQFLDEKEEETKKKKAEADRIATEIQKKKEKEKQEVEQEKRKMDDVNATAKDKRAELEPSGKHGTRGSSIQPADEKDLYKKNGYRRSSRGSQSPDSSYGPRSPRQKHSPASSKSSSSRSHSDLRRRSRSSSRAHLSRSRSVSPNRRRRSSPRRSVTPRRRHTPRRSPSPWHRSSHSRRRSTSRSRRRSRSPARYRVDSPLRYRSRSPLRRRSRSPVRHKSQTPLERSPMYRGSRIRTQRRSPSPYKGRSPSPARGKHPYSRNRGSPPSVVRRSRSPSGKRDRLPYRHRRSPSPARRRYQRSPTRSLSPVQRRSSIRGQKGSVTPVRRRSPSQDSSSFSPVRQTVLSTVRRETAKSVRSPLQSTRERVRQSGNYSPGAVSSDESAGSPSVGRNHSEERRSISPPGSPNRRRGRVSQPESLRPSPKGAGHKSLPDSGEGAHKDSFSGREIGDDKRRSSRKNSPRPIRHEDIPEFAGIRGVTDITKSRKPQLLKSERVPDRTDRRENHERKDPKMTRKMTELSEKENKICAGDGDRVVNKNNVPEDDNKGRVWEPEAFRKSSRNTELSDGDGSLDKNKVNAGEKRKHKRDEDESDDHSSYDSWEERKEKKRRRKEEKKLRKEERRRRREERSRRKEERRAEKQKMKSADANSSSSDLGEEEGVQKRSNQSREVESDPKKLEIELREKALKSLRAKKGLSD